MQQMLDKLIEIKQRDNPGLLLDEAMREAEHDLRNYDQIKRAEIELFLPQ